MANSAAAASAASSTTISAHSTIPTSVIVHPLVLLSATDHYMRVNKETSKRVVGVLLGAKEIAGERDSWKVSTHEGQVRILLAGFTAAICLVISIQQNFCAVFASWDFERDEQLRPSI